MSAEEENVFTPNQESEPTKFQSPIPFLRQFRNLIFGKKAPDMYTRITFYMNVVIWTTFLIWEILSYFALTSSELFIQKKGIPIHSIVEKRGLVLGFEEGEFLDRLITFHAISIICWLAFFIGLIMMYRKLKKYIYFTIAPLIFFIGMNIFYLSFTYFMEDTTAYDKIALLVLIISNIVHSYLLNNKSSGGTSGFFGEPIEDDA